MSKDRVVLRIGGAAGEGIASTGDIIAKNSVPNGIMGLCL